MIFKHYLNNKMRLLICPYKYQTKQIRFHQYSKLGGTRTCLSIRQIWLNLKETHAKNPKIMKFKIKLLNFVYLSWTMLIFPNDSTYLNFPMSLIFLFIVLFTRCLHVKTYQQKCHLTFISIDPIQIEEN